MAQIKQGSLTGPKKPSSMTTVGELKGVVGGMRKAYTQREDERTMLQKNRNLGLAPDQDKAAATRIAQLRKENAYYAPIAERYQGLIDNASKPVRNSKMPLAPTQFPGKK
jgi:hypothetical protein